MSNISLYFRLALATGLVLAPGWALARALGVRSVAATLAWSLTLLFGTLALTFLLQSTLTLTLALLAVAAIASLSVDLVRRIRTTSATPGRWLAAGGGAAVGILLWSVAGTVQGDGLFHLARVRKLFEFDELSLDAVSEFTDASLHPGYAFPLWHGFVALIAKLSGADPEQVVLHLPSILAVLAVVGGRSGGGRAGRDRLLRAGERRRVPGALAAGDVVAAAPRAGGARARLRGDAFALDRALPARGRHGLGVPG